MNAKERRIVRKQKTKKGIFYPKLAETLEKFFIESFLRRNKMEPYTDYAKHIILFRILFGSSLK